MTDRPIIFSAPMILALLAGRKTQTRRVLKPQPEPFDALFSKEGRWWTGDDETGEVYQVLRVPFAPGDRLWVKEAWRFSGVGRRVDQEACKSKRQVEYRADGYDPISWMERSPLHMPRWASRLTLTVTDVRVQRLQEISEADAVDEGCVPDDQSLNPNYVGPARSLFESLWNSLHGPDAWSASPWVAAITFTVERRNIDA